LTTDLVAIILARGGSKGVPDKNLRSVGGKTLVQRSIESAISAFGASRVFVSSDSDAILSASRAAGVGVIRRPAELSTDSATSESALSHGLDLLCKTHGLSPKVVAFLQPTSPFVLPASLEAGFRKVLSGQFDCVFSAAESHKFLWKIHDGLAVELNHRHQVRLRRQERSKEFEETGAFYFMNAEMFRTLGHRFFGRIGVQIVPAWTSIDIDEERDFAVAAATLALPEYIESGLDAIDGQLGLVSLTSADQSLVLPPPAIDSYPGGS